MPFFDLFCHKSRTPKNGRQENRVAIPLLFFATVLQRLILAIC